MRVLEVLTDLLYPPKCPFCGRVQDRRLSEPCPRCRDSLPRTAPEEHKAVENCDGCLAPLWYQDGVPDAVRCYKFGGGRDHAALLGALMAGCAAERMKEPADLITWAPLSAKRLRERGYDQAELLAVEVGLRLDLPVVRLLEKVRDARPQSGLEDEAERRRNVSGAYRALPGTACAGKRVLLVDDVITTGATLSECAAALREAGAAPVTALGLAWARN